MSLSSVCRRPARLPALFWLAVVAVILAPAQLPLERTALSEASVDVAAAKALGPSMESAAMLRSGALRDDTPRRNTVATIALAACVVVLSAAVERVQRAPSTRYAPVPPPAPAGPRAPPASRLA